MNIKYYILLIIILFGLNRCTERIDNLDVKEAFSKVVIYGKITTDTMVHEVRVTKTSDYYANKPPVSISGAVVKIFDGTSFTILTENPNQKGYYQTPASFFGLIGKTYTLTVANVEGSSIIYRAESRISDIFKMDSIQFEYITEWQETNYWSVRLSALDPIEKNYYSFKTLRNKILLTDSLSNFSMTDDRFYNGKYVKEIECQYLRDDRTDEKVNDGDTITLECNSIPEDYYRFILEAQTELRPQNPLFSGPAANVRTNLEGGALGYFAAYSIARKSKIVHFSDYKMK